MYEMWKNYNKTENLYESKNIDYNINEGTFYIIITAIAFKDCLDYMNIISNVAWGLRTY